MSHEPTSQRNSPFPTKGAQPRPIPPHAAEPQHHAEVPKQTLLERVVAQFAELTISCVEPLLKTITTFGILVAATLGVSFGQNVAFLPYLAVIGGTLAIVLLWRSNNRSMVQKDHKEIQHLKKKMAQLHRLLEDYDERLGNVEMLESFEERLARKEVSNNSILSSRLPHKETLSPSPAETDDTPPPMPGPHQSA